jgi:3-dehydroquinate synthase
MAKKTVKYSSSSTDFYFNEKFSALKNIIDTKNAVFITDENVFAAHPAKFKSYTTIVLNAGEAYKVQATVDSIIQQLIAAEADRKTFLVGVGGGVVTDIAGYVASIYMRGIKFGFVPTTLLGLVDASIGGKNGIDVGVYKNIVGNIQQPDFILHDYSLLQSLPEKQYRNGFAEIIKHACIKDAALFKELQANDLNFYWKKKSEMASLIQRNANIKIKIVQRDEFEKNERRLLNFGHTLGHALENQYELLHGEAISIGMAYACNISKQLLGFKQTDDVVKTLQQYGLPTHATFNKQKVFDVLKMDKKREKKEMNFILLERIGKGIIKSIPLNQLQQIINNI